MVLTDRAIYALKPAAPGKRYVKPDGLVPGLGVLVTDKGPRSFVLVARYPGGKKDSPDSKNPTRRSLGDIGAITLAAVRDKARDWHMLIKQGIDPGEREAEQRRVEAEKRLAAEREKLAIFSAVLEIFISDYVSKLRTAPAVKRRLRNEVLPVWGDKSIHSITRDDVEDLICTIRDRPAPEYARSVFDDVRMMLNWCVEVVKRDKPYKLAVSPAYHVRPSKLIGKRKIETRVLDDGELAALWRATANAGYPIGPMTRMLALTGCRLSEVAGAQWREFSDQVWTIPPERFKSGVAHRLPITEDMATLLAALPRFEGGDFLFSTRHGKLPVSGFSHAKRRIDEYMPAGTAPFSFHDVRRSVRTRLSQLRVDREVAEIVIGHGKRGLERVYNQYEFEAEVRDALTRWQGLLRSIVDPKPNVLTFPTQA
jgi:integrase